MAKKNEGKEFENQWKDSCPDNIYLERFKDSAMFGSGQKVTAHKNPCDYIMYDYPCLFLLEMKSTKGTSFSFDEKIIKQHQIDSLLKASKIRGVIAGFLFNFRERKTKTSLRENSVYYVDIKDFENFKVLSEKKSINEEDCKRIGLKVDQRKKITRYDYDITGFTNKIKGTVK